MSDNDQTRRKALYPTMTKDTGNALTGLFGMGQPETKVGGLLSDFLSEGNALTPTELHTNPRVSHLAGKGLENPMTITEAEVRELCGEVLRHVRRMQGKG